MILGVNGYIWICKHVPLSPELENQPQGLFSNENDEISLEDRECIARVANIVRALANRHVAIHESIIAYAYEVSLEYPIKDILSVDTQAAIVEQAQFQVDQTMDE